MKNKLRLLTCFLLICAIIPANLTFADPSIDSGGDGIHIDDIVYYLSHTGPLSNSDIRNLLDQIAPKIPLPPAGEVAAMITSVAAPAAGEISLTLPTVPTGKINSSSNLAIIGTNGAITPPSAATNIDLIFTVTRISDSTTANTSIITVKLPALEPIFIPRPESSINVALASNGGHASASTTLGNFSISSINNGWPVISWGQDGGGWNDTSPDVTPPEWVQVEFNESKTINEIDVFTLRDDYGVLSKPTIDMTFNSYGITDYDVQYCGVGDCNADIDDNWVTVTNGSVTNNNYVWKQFIFSPVTTHKIRIKINKANGGHSRLVELEAWTLVQ
jgi:hypothetical protein